MKFSEPIREATFLKRYNRFFADVKLAGAVTVAHVPNTGSLKSCLFEEVPCLVTESTNPERKIKNTLQFIKTPTSWVGVNTGLPNKLVFEMWVEKLVPHWKKYKAAKLEFKFSKETRFDLALALSEEDLEKRKVHYVEVKNVTLGENGVAKFPDSVTTRGQKHLRELTSIVKKGGSAEQVFVIQRTDCKVFSPADEIDPDYAELLRKAVDAGVIVKAYACEFLVDDLSAAGIRILPKAVKLKL